MGEEAVEEKAVEEEVVAEEEAETEVAEEIKMTEDLDCHVTTVCGLTRLESFWD